MANLFVATLGRPVPLLGKVGIPINEPVTRQRPGTIVSKGVISGVIGLPDTEGMCL